MPMRIRKIREFPYEILEFSGVEHLRYSRAVSQIETVFSPRMLHKIAPAQGSRNSRKRIARGNSGSGGTTAGRGTKGQQARTGKGRRHGFEGGQTPLLRRQPKLGGFRNPCRRAYEVLSLGDLSALPAGAYDRAALCKAGLIRTNKPVKLLARGEVKGKYTLKVDAASAAAKQALEKAGGSILAA